MDTGFGVHQSRRAATNLSRRFLSSQRRVNNKQRLFAATLPLEMLKMVTMSAARKQTAHHGKHMTFVDLSKAHLCPLVQKQEYVELPREKSYKGNGARMLCAFFGMRKAASSWKEEVTSCCFYQVGRESGPGTRLKQHESVKRQGSWAVKRKARNSQICWEQMLTGNVKISGGKRTTSNEPSKTWR